MKTVFKLLLMAVAYLAIFILGAASGAIHPACYAYIGALLPLLSAFVYLTTATTIRSFGTATLLNGFILVLFLIAGEADTSFIIGIVALTALAELHSPVLGRHTKQHDAVKYTNAQFKWGTKSGKEYLDLEPRLTLLSEQSYNVEMKKPSFRAKLFAFFLPFLNNRLAVYQW